MITENDIEEDIKKNVIWTETTAFHLNTVHLLCKPKHHALPPPQHNPRLMSPHEKKKKEREKSQKTHFVFAVIFSIPLITHIEVQFMLPNVLSQN